MRTRWVFILILLLGVAGCGDDESVEEVPGLSLAEELGMAVYLGAVSPAEVGREGDAVVWTFDPEDGPMCMRGDPFRASMRRTEHSDLVVFLQGGGACWSEFCLAVVRAPAGVPRIDLLNPELEDNPVADWNALYLPYCDGSLFIGDRDHDDDGDGEPDRFHRGLHNLSAALTAAREEMPEPGRVLLAGASAGGYGTVLAALLVRHVWPEAEVMVMNDSGVGVARDGDAAFLRGLLDEFNVLRFVPESCEGCLEEGHVVPLVSWMLEQDPDIRIGVFSSLQDKVISEVFLEVEPEAFESVLRRETDAVHGAHPDRYRRFLVEGDMHTTVLGDVSGIVGSDLTAVEMPPGAFGRLSGLRIGKIATTVDHEGGRFADWLRGLVEGDDGLWRDIVPPERAD